MDIICSKCYKHLFKHSDDNIFGAIHYALHNGFIYKNAVLFTGVDTKLFFCSKECKDSYYEANIPKNEEVSQALGKLRKDIPSMAEDVCNKMHELTVELWKRR